MWLLVMLDGGGGPGWMLESAGTGTRSGSGGCRWLALMCGCEVKGAVLRGAERSCWVVVSGEVEVEGEWEGEVEFESAQRRGRRWRRGPSAEAKTKHCLSHIEKLLARSAAYAVLLQGSKPTRRRMKTRRGREFEGIGLSMTEHASYADKQYCAPTMAKSASHAGKDPPYWVVYFWSIEYSHIRVRQWIR